MFIESVSVFSVGYSDLVTTIFYISVPMLLTNMEVEKMLKAQKFGVEVEMTGIKRVYLIIYRVYIVL